jgi:hypothetical protein
MAPEVELLREFRDLRLAATDWGGKVIKVYYRLSPPVARRLEGSKGGKRVVRAILWFLIRFVEHLMAPN